MLAVPGSGGRQAAAETSVLVLQSPNQLTRTGSASGASSPSDLGALCAFLLGREQKATNERQIHMDNPRHGSREEMIVFEVMKVLPEARKLHSIFFFFSILKACALILEKHEQTLAGRKANSTDLPFNGGAPCLL